MANPEHLQILKQGVEVWNRWRVENPRIRPDLDRISLGGVRLETGVIESADDLRNAYLINAASERSLKSAYLDSVNFIGATIRDADLTNANLHQAFFSHADLEGTRLVAANLESARLERANLKNTRLALANFKAADLIETCLVGAEIGNARFVISDLTNANLEGAELRGTFFWRADLDGARLSNVTMGAATFADIDLSRAKGLDAIEHVAPSTVGIDTLERSNGRIPESFLRGAGVSERLLDYARSLLNRPIGFISCLISYSHSDSGLVVHLLYKKLQARGIRCWLDKHEMKPGDRILDVVNDAIRLHDKILLCCSEASLNSWWVKDEIRKAMERERRDGRDIIIPLMVDRYLLDGWEDGLAADLRSRLAADFTGWEHDNAKFEEQFERVVRALRTDEAAQKLDLAIRDPS
jgi:uncharacterized protein YjbI with pentapeptide repeats